MQKIKLFLIGIIAINLTLLSMVALGIMPTLHANETISKAATGSNMYMNVPVNADGSITVKLAPNEVMDVDIKKIDGNFLYGRVLEVKIEK